MSAVLVGAAGLVAGCLLALVAEIVPDRSGGGRSVQQCAKCEIDLPLVALLPNRSACVSCGLRTSSARLPIVITTSVTFFAIAAIVGTRWQLLPILVLAASLITLSAVDMTRFRLPDRLVFPSLALSVGLIAVLSVTHDASDHITRAIITGLAYSAVLFTFNLIYPAGLAFGDVKLALLLGVYLGWSASSGVDAARMVIWALLVGMVLGIFSGLLVGLGRRAFGPGFLPDPDFPPADDGTLDPLLKTAFPFGPALGLSTLMLVVLSDHVLTVGSILA